nr:hypothetical protein CFP56_72088 [Quercus suber]
MSSKMARIWTDSRECPMSLHTRFQRPQWSCSSKSSTKNFSHKPSVHTCFEKSILQKAFCTNTSGPCAELEKLFGHSRLHFPSRDSTGHILVGYVYRVIESSEVIGAVFTCLRAFAASQVLSGQVFSVRDSGRIYRNEDANGPGTERLCQSVFQRVHHHVTSFASEDADQHFMDAERISRPIRAKVLMQTVLWYIQESMYDRRSPGRTDSET